MNPQPFTTCVGSSARPAREAARRGRLPSRAAAWRRTRRGSCRSRASAAIAVERFVAVATPAVRILARGARFTRVPWVLVASTSVSLTTTIRAGVREVRVIGSLLAHRLEQETGAAADPALVKKLAVERDARRTSAPPGWRGSCAVPAPRSGRCCAGTGSRAGCAVSGRVTAATSGRDPGRCCTWT